jgi:hypothetical protein
MPKVIQNPRYSEVFGYFFLRTGGGKAFQGRQEVNRFIMDHRYTPLFYVGVALSNNWDRIISMAHLIGDLAVNAASGPRRISAEQIDTFVDATFMTVGVESLVNSIVIAAWTMFESLAGDLWIGLVDVRPKQLYTPITGHVAPHDWDNLGERLSQQFNLSKLDKIQSAYAKAFGEQSDLAKVFDNQDLVVLYACRNLLVHSGGVVDTKFLERVDKHDPLSKSVLNDTVEIRGPLACTLIECARSASLKLLGEADRWLAANPP